VVGKQSRRKRAGYAPPPAEGVLCGAVFGAALPEKGNSTLNIT
jgi:hypothetical protein